MDEDCEVLNDDELWAHSTRVAEDEGLVSMPNNKSNIFQAGPSRQGKHNSLDTFNSQAKKIESKSQNSQSNEHATEEDIKLVDDFDQFEETVQADFSAN